MKIHLSNKPDPATLESIADFICGDNNERYPVYRSSSYLTRFFKNIDINAEHDGSTRKWWVLNVLEQLPLNFLEKVILHLVDIREYKANKDELKIAIKSMNDILFMENLKIGLDGSTPYLKKLGDKEQIILDDEIINETQDEVESFLEREFKEQDISIIGLGSEVTNILQSRIIEAQNNLKHGNYLSSVIIVGSILEGLLLGVASKFPAEFNRASSAPKDKQIKVRRFQDWKLSEFINAACELGFIDLDIKKFSHAVRDFRNYIHPYEQMVSKFSPTQNTAQICLQVLNGAIENIVVEFKNRYDKK